MRGYKEQYNHNKITLLILPAFYCLLSTDVEVKAIAPSSYPATTKHLGFAALTAMSICTTQLQHSSIS